MDPGDSDRHRRAGRQLIAKTAGAEATVEIRASAGAPVLAEITDAKGKLALVRQSSLFSQVVSPNRVPIMWRGRRRRGWPWRGTRDLGGPAENEGRESERAEAGFRDFDSSARDID